MVLVFAYSTALPHNCGLRKHNHGDFIRHTHNHGNQHHHQTLENVESGKSVGIADNLAMQTQVVQPSDNAYKHVDAFGLRNPQ